MGGIILVASIVVWALGYFPHDESLSPVQQKEQSYIGSIGKAVEPVFELQGFNWKLDVSLIAGVVLLVIGLLGSPALLRLLNTKDDLLPGAILYLRVYFLGMPALALYNFGNAIFSATRALRRRSGPPEH